MFFIFMFSLLLRTGKVGSRRCSEAHVPSCSHDFDVQSGVHVQLWHKVTFRAPAGCLPDGLAGWPGAADVWGGSASPFLLQPPLPTPTTSSQEPEL